LHSTRGTRPFDYSDARASFTTRKSTTPYENKGRKQVAIAKKNHVEKVFGGAAGKPYWQEVKKLTKTAGFRLPTITDSNDEIAHTSQEKAEMLSKQYASIWTQSPAAPLRHTNACTTCDKHKCTRGWVVMELRRLRSSKATGVDMI
jgi:hypothetical protein